MERKIYIIQDCDTGFKKLVKLTLEQAEAIEWFIRVFDLYECNIDSFDEMDDIDAP